MSSYVVFAKAGDDLTRLMLVFLVHSIITAWLFCISIRASCPSLYPDLIKCNTCTQSRPSLTPNCSLSFGKNSPMVNKQEEVCDNNLHGLCMWWCHQEEVNTHTEPLPFKETRVACQTELKPVVREHTHIRKCASNCLDRWCLFKYFMAWWDMMAVHWKMSICSRQILGVTADLTHLTAVFLSEVHFNINIWMKLSAVTDRGAVKQIHKGFLLLAVAV